MVILLKYSCTGNIEVDKWKIGKFLEKFAGSYCSCLTTTNIFYIGNIRFDQFAILLPEGKFMLRYYHFSADELAFDSDGQLRTDMDPKSAWAGAHPERFPVEVNAAPLNELLRVPGVGPTSARAIIQARRGGKLSEIGDLRRLGARADRAAPFVVLAGRRPPYQPPLPF